MKKVTDIPWRTLRVQWLGLMLKHPVETTVIKATEAVNTKKWDSMEEATINYGEGRIREDL